MAAATDLDTMRAQVVEHPFWYHTIDITPDLATPGWFDLRNVVERMPWPNVKGKRCLDIGTFDGFFAFLMERRGAAEVVAVDVEDHLLWDWPPDYREANLDRDIAFTGPPKGAGFRVARDLLGSKVDWRAISIYDLNPESLGHFDVVVCGSLLLHLRDPIRALEAVRTVTQGVFLSSEQIELWLTVLGRGRPLFKLRGSGRDCQWWLANGAGHGQMLHAAGFAVERRSQPFVAAFASHPTPPLRARHVPARAAARLLTGVWTPGVLHRALLARPRV